MLRAGSDPETVALSADGGHAYIANEDTAQASVVQLSDRSITRRSRLARNPKALASRLTANSWVTSEDAGAIYVIDLIARKVLKSVEVGRARDRLPPA